MTATFLLPLAIGACETVGEDVVAAAFGVVALVAMTPLLAIQLLGIFYRFRSRTPKKVKQLAPAYEEIIEFM